MNSRSISTHVLIIFVIFVAVILSHGSVRVEATRVLSEDFASANHLDMTYSTSLYEKAKHSMAYWLERLPSGPSPSGPGH
ncbi:hypothetical protein I3843_01G164100 [Carya illinoinensis]|uniref:Transmembrane protein n=1 Tax=Carya illinoinensis TaxID=32201 RepID=A0A922K8I9_CARIL|nr:hypothetical protein I3842_01G171100 [Carya illinoinensis]KAG7996512.1 hypothetical protein I3843_01G164100 [Carya illinoinensis]